MDIIKKEDAEVLTKALTVLKNGGILIYPTETCYGVGVDATNSDAVTKVLKYKKRPEGKAISIGCYDMSMASKYVDINETAKKIYQNFLPGPVTVISNSKNKVDPRLASEKNTLGIRVPDYDLLRKIISKFGKPITTTSANSNGKKTPYTVDDILKNLSKKQLELVDLIIDAGRLPKNPPSTVVDTTTEELKTYRAGVVELSNKVTQKWVSSSEEETVNIGENFIKEHFTLSIKSPLTILLLGDLGAGKTHFTKGIAKGLGISKIIKSPTYNYYSEYEYSKEQNKGVLYHLDAWRVESKEDIDMLRMDSWQEKGNIIVIEWPDVLQKIEPDKSFMRSVVVSFHILPNGYREIIVLE